MAMAPSSNLLKVSEILIRNWKRAIASVDYCPPIADLVIPLPGGTPRALSAIRYRRVPIDAAAGSTQEYVEDCPVCCRANVIHVEIDEGGEARVWAKAE